MRDNDMKAIKVCVNGNKLCMKNGGYMPGSLGSRSINVGRQAVRQKFLRFNNFDSVTSKA